MGGKDFFASKANWGIILMAVALALEPFGVEFDVESAAGWMAETSVSIAAAAGAVLALWGRFTATKPIVSFMGMGKK